MKPLRQRMLDDLQIRNYSPHTVAAYVRGVAEFASISEGLRDLLGAEQIRELSTVLGKRARRLLADLHTAVSGLRFLYTHTLHQQVSIEHIPLPRTEKNCRSS